MYLPLPDRCRLHLEHQRHLEKMAPAGTRNHQVPAETWPASWPGINHWPQGTHLSTNGTGSREHDVGWRDWGRALYIGRTDPSSLLVRTLAIVVSPTLTTRPRSREEAWWRNWLLQGTDEKLPIPSQRRCAVDALSSCNSLSLTLSTLPPGTGKFEMCMFWFNKVTWFVLP